MGSVNRNPSINSSNHPDEWNADDADHADMHRFD